MVQWLRQMIGYSQESSKIKVKDNQLKNTQITVTQNYSVLAHCSKLLSAHLLNFTQHESENESKGIHVNGDNSYRKYFTNYIYEWFWVGKTIQSRLHLTVDFQSIGKTYSVKSISYRYLDLSFTLIIWSRLTAEAAWTVFILYSFDLIGWFINGSDWPSWNCTMHNDWIEIPHFIIL